MISFVITAKNEPYLEQTVDSIKKNAVLEHEILVEEDDGRGQRAMINKLATEASGEILCKVDAHCSFGPEFDRILLEDLDEKTVIAPLLLPLEPEHWTVSHHNKMANYVCDTNLVMQHAPTAEGRVVETMVMQGSFFMCYKDFFYEANLCDESLGSWGSQGCELGIQTWKHGGRCLTSKKTYYGHVFRHTDKDFPYKRNQQEIDRTYNLFLKKFKDDPSLKELARRFNYPLDWSMVI